ncbi:hypothetical protein OEZ85_011949 [Tetradesmus obliquus]|uniref:Cilia- and flagella-associated protein 45 n=1 Tax=Tetradesmus obliquus TaxID=3088 RepID=A0ABY8TRU9_TETOB|nr:hypothetical protein OEZ85_011949 [Tetradesmus obliquus]
MGRAGSNASLGSARSNKSSTYRTVARDSYVDDSLFGNKSPSPSKDVKQQPQSPGATAKATKSMYRSALVKAERKPEVVTLTEADLQRMLADAPIMTAEQVSSMRHAAEERKEAERAAAKARKEKMLRLEEEARKQAPPTESQVVRAQADNAMLSRAHQLLEEEKDEVKHMNQMVQYAKCVAVRDKQMQEKMSAMLAEEEEQKRLDLVMEIERLRALEAYQARDVQRREEQARSAAILQEQLTERQRQRLREEEMRDQERMAMARELERLQHEEAAAAAAKKARAAALMEEVAASNAEQIERKKQLEQQEWEEEMRIAEYIRRKDAREQALAAEKEAIAREKEMEVARLRAMQEKQADHQSEQDELRARRYQEAKEREWRAKERAAAERQAAMMADLAAAREAQMRSKLVAQATMAQVEQTEFMRVLTVNQEKEEQQRSQAAAQHQISEAYKRDLLGQIQAHAEAKRAERAAYLEEGKKIRQVQQQEKATLEEIKVRKLQELACSGVPEKYQAELARMRIKSAK